MHCSQQPLMLLLTGGSPRRRAVGFECLTTTTRLPVVPQCSASDPPPSSLLSPSSLVASTHLRLSASILSLSFLFAPPPAPHPRPSSPARPDPRQRLSPTDAASGGAPSDELRSCRERRRHSDQPRYAEAVASSSLDSIRPSLLFLSHIFPARVK
jgi:hypothetical protein